MTATLDMRSSRGQAGTARLKAQITSQSIPRERVPRQPSAGVESSADGVADHLVHRLGEAVELADIEIDPALRLAARLLRNQHDLRLDNPGVADHAAAGLDDRLRDAVAEMPAQRAKDRAAIDL